ncbi:hypothetical protein Dimus_027379 [Dionaea muscipula]
MDRLAKEVARLRGLGSGGAETQDDDTVSVGFPPSPGSFRWEGVHGSFSPLTSDRRTSQVCHLNLAIWTDMARHFFLLVYKFLKQYSFFHKKEYEVALVGAFRREKDKDMALRALAAENLAIMQLVSPQRPKQGPFSRVILA